MKNKEIIKKYIREIVNTGNLSKLESFISEDYVEVMDGERFEAGLEGARNHILGVRNTYPDLELKIEKQVEEGEWVATSYIMTGTHMGEWMGIRPTGRKIKVSGVNFDRVVKGKIVEHGGAANLLHPLLEAGAIKVCS